jgi:hypothetical protein
MKLGLLIVLLPHGLRDFWITLYLNVFFNKIHIQIHTKQVHDKKNERHNVINTDNKRNASMNVRIFCYGYNIVTC